MPRLRRSVAAAPAGAAAAELPRWDLTVLYPAVDSPEFTAAFDRVVAQIAELGDLFDAEGVGDDGAREASVASFERVVDAYNAALDATEVLGSYLYGHVSTDAEDEVAQGRFSQLIQAQVALSTLGTRFVAWVGGLDVDGLIARSSVAADHAFPLRQAREAARHLMPPGEEALAAALEPSAGSAWSKLHDDVTSRVTARIEVDGEEQELPLSALRNLAMAPDRDLRRRAYEAELGAMAAVAVPLAAAMNGIKGEVNTLSTRRRWDDPLDEALFHAAMDRETLDVLIAAARESFPNLRRYLRAKARALGIERLAWYDLFAPVGRSSRSWDWPEAMAFLEAQFATYSDRLSGLARRSFAERWVDAGPRPGKVGGAFCMRLRGDESRILANFAPNYGGMATMAHELGHAYHNLNEGNLTALQRETPMTLAETASTFCETIVREAALVEADPAEQLYILEQSLQDSSQVIVDIISRFDFERQTFAGRQERDLSVAELNASMLDAQRGTYGDALDPDQLHPYMWAVKRHYYSAGRSYYNFPYLFGLLFGLGLYARYRAEPATFPERYDHLLASTGRAPAADLAAAFGIDLRSPAFWRSSLDVVRADVDRFERSVADLHASNGSA